MLSRAGALPRTRAFTGRPIWIAVLSVVGLLLASANIPAQKGEILSEDEEDKVRETQEPSGRIELYLDFIQDRLVRFDDYRNRPVDPRYDTAPYLEKQLDQCIQLNDELKNWIEYQFQRDGDMRKGLRKVLDWCPKQLAELRHVQDEPDAYTPAYKGTLRDAIDDFSDTLDGATKVLAEQEKRWGQLKREAKEDAQASKQRAKDEKKRTKEEEKLRKQQRKKGAPPVSDED